MRAIVLAAGKGTRLGSQKEDCPKVLREIMGKPLIDYVLSNIDFIKPEDIYIIVGYKKEMVINHLGDKYNYCNQEVQKGTGHAVMMAESYFENYSGDVLLVYGDMPLFKKDTYKKLTETHTDNESIMTMLTATVENTPAYGRIIRDNVNNFNKIVEQKDCTSEQLLIKEVNVGIYVIDSKILFDNLCKLKANNIQKELYLTDIPKILKEQGMPISIVTTHNHDEIWGVNTIEDLNKCENIILSRMK